MTGDARRGQRQAEGADDVAGDRHHQRPPVPHGLRGRPGGPSQRLAQDLDQRIDKLRGNFGEIGDARLTIMAALMVADELADIAGRLKRVEEELAVAAGGARRLRRARQGDPGRDLPPRSMRRPSGSRA